MEKRDIKSLYMEEIEEFLVSIGEPKYRAKQIFHWIQEKKIRDFRQITNISRDLQELLCANFTIPFLNVQKKLVSTMDHTVKFLYEYNDGEMVEAVYMEYRHGNSLCISTQVGCRMGCTFCASAIAGFVRNLQASEMLAQIEAAEEETGNKITNVVLMGIGEPLDNFDQVVRFLKLVSHPGGRGMSLRNVTVSTCGLAEKIRDLADYKFGLTLAVSLHSPYNEKRGRIMPVNRRYPITEVLDACRYYAKMTGRRITYEYALIRGENDSDSDARELAGLLRGSLCHVNLIPVNEVKETGYRSSSYQRAKAFQEILDKCGVNATIRRTLGADIAAACGQLRRSNL